MSQSVPHASDPADPAALDASTPIDGFLDALSARRPAPGGGAAAALVGATATAAAEMVVGYSVDTSPTLAETGRTLRKTREVLLRLMVEDQSGYAALTAARRAAKADPSRPDVRADVQSLVRVCVATPQAICAASVTVLRSSRAIVPDAKVFLLSDLQVAVDVALGAARAAARSVWINLPDLADTLERAAVADATRRLLADADRLAADTLAQIASRAKGS